MKTRLFLAIRLVPLLLLISQRASALIPEPGNIYYGIVKKQDGAPLADADKATVALRIQRGNVLITVASTDIIGTGDGKPNYILRVSLDDGVQPIYSPLAALADEQPVAALIVAGQEFPLSGALPPIGGRGAIQEANLSLACADTDADGLCDDWERKYFGNLTAQDGKGDPDRDGFNNLSEQVAGTDPTLSISKPPDLRPVLILTMLGDDFIKISWQTKPGRSDTLEWALDPAGPYEPVPQRRMTTMPDGRTIDMIGVERRFIRLSSQ